LGCFPFIWLKRAYWVRSEVIDMRDSDGPLGPADRRFMAKLYERYADYIYSATGKYTKNKAVREDIAQEAVERLINNCASLRDLPDRALTAYIAFTVKSAALDQLGDKHNEAEPLDPHPEPPVEALSPEEELIRREEIDRCSACLREIWPQLTPREQILLEGRYIWDLGDKELSEILHCKAGSVRMLRTRARRRALKLIMEGGYFDE